MKSSTGKPRVLVTGGPTRAYLDRVRFLSNFSTGELAFELCRRLKADGFEVALVSGPCCPPFETLKLDRWKLVETAAEMRAETLDLCRRFRPDYAVFAAAVLDFEPARVGAGKTSSKIGWTLRLKPTPKIIDAVAKRFPKVGRVGFKLEWKKPDAAGRDRLARKRIRDGALLALVLNFLPEIGAAAHPAYLYAGVEKPVQVRRKAEIARWISRVLAKSWKDRSRSAER